MVRGRFTTQLAILAIPMMLSAGAAGAAPAEPSAPPAEDQPCKHMALSLLPISLCRFEP